MSSLPLALAVPAAAAGLAYLDAKTSFWYDRKLFGGLFPGIFKARYREYRDRINFFYRLEDLGTGRSHNKVGILFEDKSWTYGQMYDAALRYGNYFRTKYDLKKGDIVAMDMMNSDQFLLIMFGLWSIGVKPGLINYNLTGDALCHCVNVANSVLLLVDQEVAGNVDENVRAKIGGLKVEIVSPEFVEEAFATEPVGQPDELRSGDLCRDMAVLIYTSGTTGLPKAAIVSWGKITMSPIFMGCWLSMKASDILYTSMPLYHASGLVMGAFNCFQSGTTIAVGRKFSSKIFWADVRKHKATVIQYVGETCRYLLAAPPQIDPETGKDLDKENNVRLAMGNGLRPDVWAKFQERFAIVAEFYAATEGFFGTWNYSRNEFARGAIGRVGWLYDRFTSKKVAIVARDHETDEPWRDPKTGLCRKMPRGEVGEMLFLLPEDMGEVFQGYYKNDKATDGKVIRNVLVEGDAYFRTGDLISWDYEGRIYFHDRIGDTFRWKSENVATTEVSAMIGMHPAVDEANVYGVELPHHDGRAGCAAITLKTSTPDAETMRSLAQHARDKLPKYAVPLFLRFGKGLTTAMTGTNKQQKHNLRVEGVNPVKVGDDEIFWLQGDTYVKFHKTDWDRLDAGQVKL
ncbi:acetyl-CoA synthetase-like protein [Xylariaceae sp. FL1272]|nr:acetyl-CoA synthetase-like protein [Xylariaceae sp. FL1272]